MNTEIAATGFATPRGPDSARAARLLQLGIRGPTRPVDRLMGRLGAPDGHEWFEYALDELTRTVQPGLRDLLLNTGTGGALENTAAPLRDIKDRCKKLTSKGKPGDEPLVPMLGYFLALGAALAHHRTMMSSVPRPDIDSVLLDIACMVPDPWADMLCRATLAET